MTKARKPAKVAALSDPIAQPYEQTARDKAALASQAARLAASRPAPRIKVANEQKGVTQLQVTHPDPAISEALFCESLGTSSSRFASVITAQLAQLASVDGAVDETVLNENLALVRGINPQDELEALLACQMAAVHSATMLTAMRVRNSTEVHRRDTNVAQLNKLGRTFTAQVEALKRYRSKGDQRVVVEHKHYYLAAGALGPGSQAVLGDLTQGGGEDAKSEVLPHERMLLSERPPVLGNIEANGSQMQGAGLDGLERVPVPRGTGRTKARADA